MNRDERKDAVVALNQLCDANVTMGDTKLMSIRDIVRLAYDCGYNRAIEKHDIHKPHYIIHIDRLTRSARCIISYMIHREGRSITDTINQLVKLLTVNDWLFKRQSELLNAVDERINQYNDEHIDVI